MDEVEGMQKRIKELMSLITLLVVVAGGHVTISKKLAYSMKAYILSETIDNETGDITYTAKELNGPRLDKIQ